MSNRLNHNYNRREVLVLGSAVAAVGVVALSGCGEASPTSAEKEDAAPPYPISAEQAAATIAELEQSPDLYEGREYADPNVLFGMSPEELSDIAGVYSNPNNQTNQGFAEDLRKSLNLYFVAGQDMQSVKDARSEGYPVGERDELSNNLGKYSKYVQETYSEHMEDGLFVRNFNGVDTTEMINVLRGYQTWAAQRYEDDMGVSINNGAEPTADGTVYSEIDSVEELPLEVSGFDRRLDISILLRRPIRGSKETQHLAMVDCYVKEGRGGKYDIVLQAAKVEKHNPTSK